MSRLLAWLPLLVLHMIEFLIGVGLLLCGTLFMSLLSSQEWVSRCAITRGLKSHAHGLRWPRHTWGHARAVLSSGITQIKSTLYGANG
jgi:hypothetical protein